MTMQPYLSQHLYEASRRFRWTECLDVVIAEIAATTKLIACAVRKGAIQTSLVGDAGYQNVQGETVKKLDEWSNALLCERLQQCGHVRTLASEEMESAMTIGDPKSPGEYIVMFDPLDGSSNIDVNATIGTIFSIHYSPRHWKGPIDLLLKGANQVAAGYATYGSATMFVYTARNGVHGFTLEPETGEYRQTHPHMWCPEEGTIYSVNEGNKALWAKQQSSLVSWYQDHDKTTKRPYSGRYIGSLVADFHRTLIKGGIFMYPADSKSPEGKLRYLYEAAPLALICEEAGGVASDGVRRILEITPTHLHQRVPLFIGSRVVVEDAVRFLKKVENLQPEDQAAVA